MGPSFFIANAAPQPSLTAHVKKQEQMMKDVIIACDFKNKQTTLDFLDQFTERKPFVKIGMELFFFEGPAIVREIKARGHKIFLDLKIHDIPNTVKSAMQSLASLEPDIIDVHSAGTAVMMKAALEGCVRADGTRPLVIAVTQLTSTTPEALRDELLIPNSMEDTVIHYAQNTMNAGLDGIVCSPLEVAAVKKNTRPNFITVTPGIRPLDASKDDQARFTTRPRPRRTVPTTSSSAARSPAPPIPSPLTPKSTTNSWGCNHGKPRTCCC